MGRKLYVGNLGFDVTNQELQDEFTAVGACESVSVITDGTPGGAVVSRSSRWCRRPTRRRRSKS